VLTKRAACSGYKLPRATHKHVHSMQIMTQYLSPHNISIQVKQVVDAINNPTGKPAMQQEENKRNASEAAVQDVQEVVANDRYMLRADHENEQGELKAQHRAALRQMRCKYDDDLDSEIEQRTAEKERELAKTRRLCREEKELAMKDGRYREEKLEARTQLLVTQARELHAHCMNLREKHQVLSIKYKGCCKELTRLTAFHQHYKASDDARAQLELVEKEAQELADKVRGIDAVIQRVEQQKLEAHEEHDGYGTGAAKLAELDCMLRDLEQEWQALLATTREVEERRAAAEEEVSKVVQGGDVENKDGLDEEEEDTWKPLAMLSFPSSPMTKPSVPERSVYEILPYLYRITPHIE
jgi:hypothetical protein